MAEGVNEQGQGGATITLLEGVTLTANFSGNVSDAFRVSPLTQLELIMRYTMDVTETGNSLELELLLSDDGVTFDQYAISSDGTPSNDEVVSTLYARIFAVTGNAGVAVNRWYAIPTSAKWFKVQVRESGLDSAGGLATIKARVSDDKTFR